MDESKKELVDTSESLIAELEQLREAEMKRVVLEDSNLQKKEFPDVKIEDWREQIEEFYADPENISRTIVCPNINNDLTDDWGMFGYGPGFIYVTGQNYTGETTINDRRSSLGLSIATDPKTGLGFMKHFDDFPRKKYSQRIIQKHDEPELFKLMCDIFNKKSLETSNQKPSLSEAKSTNPPTTYY
jgi:hypothetical protein